MENIGFKFVWLFAWDWLRHESFSNTWKVVVVTPDRYWRYVLYRMVR